MLSEAGHWVCLFWGLLGGTLDAPCDCCWATCLKLQSDPWFVAASAGPGCVWERSSCSPTPSFTSTSPRGRSAKAPRYPEICLWLPPPVGCLIGLVTEWASAGTRIAWGRFSVSHQVGVSGVHQIDAHSNSVPLLGLRPLGKIPGYAKSCCPLLGALRPGVGWVLGSYQSEASRVHQAQRDQDLAV